jgi:uncharacterized protein YjiS (DUF1127 family)
MMSTIETIRGAHGTYGRKSTPSPRGLVALMLSWSHHMIERRKTRLALYEMTDDQLKDIGISRSEAYREANRPFWE